MLPTPIERHRTPSWLWCSGSYNRALDVPTAHQFRHDIRCAAFVAGFCQNSGFGVRKAFDPAFPAPVLRFEVERFPVAFTAEIGVEP